MSERWPAHYLERRITQYFTNGGLFNPELMEHTKVRNLLLDCRDYLAASQNGVWVPRDTPAEFVSWLEREMPSGTVITNAAWWAPRVYRAVLSAAEKDGK